MSKKDQELYNEAIKKEEKILEENRDEAMFKTFMENVFHDDFYNSWMHQMTHVSNDTETLNHSFSNREYVGDGIVQVSVKFSDIHPKSIYNAYAVAANSVRLAIMDLIHKNQMDSINLKRNVPLETLRTE